MPINSNKQSSSATNALKHLYLEPEDGTTSGIEYFPYFFAETRIDFNDVRTGLKETRSLSKALEIYSDGADLLWTEDMIRDVDFEKTSAFIPARIRLAELPDFVDASFISRMETQFTQYLLRSFVARVYRNYALQVFSFSWESRDEFAGRCTELLDGPKRKDLDLLHHVFKRRLEQAKEKHLMIDEPVGLEMARLESQKKNIFYQYSERIGDLFMRGDPRSSPHLTTSRNKTTMTELEEKLKSLELEAQQAIQKLNDSYREQALALDEYILHPNPKDIHFVRSCILWMPKQAA
jgi:hypothetical protein